MGVDHKILVTGGTGFVGAEVVKQLVQQGAQVRVISSRDVKLAGAEVVRADVHRPETLTEAFKGVSAVIHCIGIIVEGKSTFQEAHVQVTKNVLAAAQAAGVRRFIQMSALGTRPNARSRYHQTKWEAEELARASGLDWTIFRASLIYGYDEKDRIFKLISRLIMPPVTWLCFRSFAVFGGGKNKVQPVSVREVGHCLSAAVTTQESIGKTLDLAGPAPVTFFELVKKIGQTEGLSVRYEFLPILTTFRAIFFVAFFMIPIIGFFWLYQPRDLTMSDTNPLLDQFWHPSRTTEAVMFAIWVISALILSVWRELIIFSVPTFIPRTFSYMAGFSEQFKMAEEDNVGDPGLTSQLFNYTPESLDKALKDYFC
jgi:NADH dehydrogenase